MTTTTTIQSIPYSRISAFTEIYNSGNPAGVCLLDIDSTDNEQWMSDIAIEMNMSETSYIRQLDSNDNSKYSIRWFCAPSGQEERLCGHATLASAYYLYSNDIADNTRPIEFHSKYSGILYAKQNNITYNNTFGIELNFPAVTLTEQYDKNSIDKSLIQAIDLDINNIISIQYHKPDLIIEVTTPDIVHNIKHVNYDVLKQSQYNYIRGVLVTAGNNNQTVYQNNNDVDFVSRCFFAHVGEDPVTGSGMLL